MGIQRKNIAKRLTSIVLAAVCLFSTAGCNKTKPAPTTTPTAKLASNTPETARQGYGLKAAILYNGKQNDGTWNDTLGYLKQSTLINLSASALDISKAGDYSGYDILYLDKSIIGAGNISEICAAVLNFTKNGGSVFLDNAFYNVFGGDFIGASGFAKVNGCPDNIVLPQAGADIQELQGIISDFAKLYKSYTNYPELAKCDYGYSAVCSTAVPIATFNGNALYTLNKYGRGYVFFTNPLLPNIFSLSGFSMQSRNKDQNNFANTTAGCNQLIYNAFAGYVSKQLYGYYMGRVFGSFGSTDMAWENHFEEITAISNNSMKIFSELCKKKLQVPSFTLIRDSYWWFLRSETVTYYLNNGGKGQLNYSLNFNEDAYSSGTHIASGNKWLSLSSIKNAGSYFVDYPQYTYRAYPALCDYNSDGVTDIFCGSADGRFYYFKGEGFTDRLHVSEAVKLTDSKGSDLNVSSYSAPQLADINGDGYPDLISGSADGKIYWFSGNGTLKFEPRGVLINTDLKGQSLPSVGDLNNDGVPDIAVGSNESILVVYYGIKMPDGGVSYSFGNMGGLSLECANVGLGKWLAPNIADYDSDGKNEIVVGTFDGYVALFSRDSSGTLKFKSYVTTDEMNYKGNNNIKTGNNCVPVFYDINSDGAKDLVCGSLEYGLAYPIDSEYFPYAKELQEQVDYAKANYFYLGPHFYTNAYASKDREEYELQAQKASLKKYGLDTAGAGTNQHTWYTSTFYPSQSLMSAYNAGLLWDSGFSPSASAITPQIAAENVVSLPFFLESGGKNTILVQNCSVLPNMDTDWTDISAKYGVPVCVFYHCDFVYESEAEALSYIQKLSDFWWKNGYNFAEENQLMAATAAAYNMNVAIKGTNLSRSAPIDISITASENSSDFPLYNKAYQNSVGAKIVFSENVDASNFVTDADVWKRDGNTLYISMNKSVSVRDTGKKADAGTHIERVNIAADITPKPNGAVITFRDNGMMQAVVSGTAGTSSEGFSVTKRDGKTIFTKYGKADTLNILYNS